MKRAWCLLAATLLLVACEPKPKPRTPEQVRAALLRMLPATLAERRAWAEDVRVSFAALKIRPSDENLCAALAVAEQESGYVADPVVPGLARIATQEIVRRAGKYGVPEFAVRAALKLDSPNGESYEKRLAHVRTEKELSEIYESLIGSIPMGRRLLAKANPVHTGGPMQVSIAFSENFARRHEYPWGEVASVRHEVFTRRGGMYFGIAHLLAYKNSYERHLYRFADFNAGFYASRNAAFQYAVTRVTGIELALDGDLLAYGKRGIGATESALRAMSTQLGMDEKQIRRDLGKGKDADFEQTALWLRTFDVADRLEGKALPRARLPGIDLHSPKISRKLTTAWFADRVEWRYRRCMARARG